MSTIQKQQENKYQKEYEEKFDEIKSITSRTKQAYVPILCKLVKKGWPDETDDWRQDKVIEDCEKRLGWNTDTVYNYIPSEFRPDQGHVKSEARKKILRIEKENAPKVEAALKYFDKITELVIREPPQPKPELISEEKLHDLGLGSYGESHKSIHRVRNEIHEGIRLLFKALCDDKDLPNDQDDLIVDYIKPTREYRLGLAMEFDQAQRTNMHNKLHFVIAAAEDMIEQLDKADKK